MKIIAKGYAHHDPLVAPDPLTVVTITPEELTDYTLRHGDLWWSYEFRPSAWERLVERIPAEPTRWSRRIGVALVVTAFLIVLAVAGAIEGRADTPDTPRRVILAAEWRAWQSMGKEAQDAYCQMYRGYAEYVWLDSMSEGAYWQESPRKLEWVAQRVLTRGCGEWQR